MLSWIIRRRSDAFEKQFSYDMSHMRELLAVSPKAALWYGRACQIGAFRQGVPADVYYVTKLVGLLHEDCGPCVQLGVQMAGQAGVAPDVLRHLIEGSWERLPPGCALGARFATAVLQRDPEADALREELQQRYGKLAVVSLAMALSAARLYPTMKYALGFGKACARVEIEGHVVRRGVEASPPEAVGRPAGDQLATSVA